MEKIVVTLWSGVRKAKKNGVARSSTPISAGMIERLKSEQREEQQLIIER